MIPFDVIAYDCKGNQDTLNWQPRILLDGPIKPPSVNVVTIRSGQTATLQVKIYDPEPAPITYAWYSAPSGGTPVAESSTFTTPPLTATTTYYAVRRNDRCESPRVPVTVTVKGPFARRLNAGGSGYTTADGKAFGADAHFTGGSVSALSTGDVRNTTEDALYRNLRFGAFAYQVATGNGTFDVILHFNENYFGYRGGGGVGSRRFHVDIEGARKLTNYDIFAAAGGAMRATTKTIRVTVSDGILNLFFSRGAAGNPSVSAIEVVAVAGARIAVESPEVSRAEDLPVRAYPNPVKDRLTVRLPFPARHVTGTAVVNAAGEGLMQDGHHVRGEYELELPVMHLKAGLYLLRLESEHGRQVVRFVKGD